MKTEAKIRVVSYSRVSSESENQLNSLANQRQHWDEYIKAKPEWEYIGFFYDQGITGTNAKKRDGFIKMYEEAKQGKFDLIITKSVTRWARNIVDSIQYVRDLKKIGVAVYFSSDNIHTINDADAELRLSIMSTLAQDESRRISENVKFGHKRAMKNGIVYGNNRVWGYDIKDKKLYINENESEIIKKIFHWYVFENESLHGIVKRLESELGVTKGKIGGKLDHSTITRILQNEKYCGDLQQRKYFTKDFLEQKQSKNNGEHEFITIKDHHEAIISREVWDNAQDILFERQVKSNRGVGYTKHCWGGKIICEVCHNKFRRKVMKNKDGTERPIWICTTAHDKGKAGCINTSYMREEVLEDATKVVIAKLKEPGNKEKILNNLDTILKNITQNNDTKIKADKLEKQIEKVKNKREKLMELFMDSNLSKDNFNLKNEELNNEELNFINRLKEVQSKEDEMILQIKKMNGFYDMLSKEYDDINEVDDIINKYFTNIIKYKDKLVFNLVMGESYDISLAKYPKRVNRRNHTPIMDTKIFYLVDRGAVRYYESLTIELRLVI